MIDPARNDRVPLLAHTEAITNEAVARFGAAGPDYLFKGCLYTTTSSEDFLLGRHGEEGFFASACSGHGFKFGPWIGRLLADFVEDKDAPENHPRFCWPVTLLEA